MPINFLYYYDVFLDSVISSAIDDFYYMYFQKQMQPGGGIFSFSFHKKRMPDFLLDFNKVQFLSKCRKSNYVFNK